MHLYLTGNALRPCKKTSHLMLLRIMHSYLTGNALRPCKNTSHLMLLREAVSVYFEDHMKRSNTLCGQNAESWYDKTRGIFKTLGFALLIQGD
jgi:hypothetical protein